MIMTPAVTWGLLVAWVIHDAEEFLAVPWWSARLPRLRARHPRVPGRLWSLIAPGRIESGVAIGIIGIAMAVAAARGAATAGRSDYFQLMLLGFGWHAVTHLAMSAVARGYTPGVVTAVILVAPFSLWAWHRLGEAGLSHPVDPAEIGLIFVLLPVVLGGSRWIGRLVESRMAARGEPTASQ
ncbi:MAG: HXXEE domain-containing protein [Kineosporiaceae bacterium]|nr:HXXEE domain-containing protein [Kineosporiaceae bacterium]MBK7624293.1 HXXEE domain-containing protein [Kineosporiaceae bacterium]MBK8075177.1 HXXEE domain-containing protein [Kineosporiaceae bacterium]